ncbi:PAS domain S-box protein [Marinobacter vulgaris]|uniref:PAS domain S-box protein n=1 Tax=Marinobacter vulgaris TaxID=1928331 RepID=A0A2V3ZNF7_9GAMM|nr:PAS domain S-box protein [Marinobacter vulgaris]PXX92648.1 PAS domain S-box protein [Marinobacter vulgaris]TSJ71408.1 PAS domain S-box protein [Marinobacter vulgaris]
MGNRHGYPTVEGHERLRQSARDLIEHGVPPRNHGGSLSVSALQLLYERAARPESAGDALKLLHELQTYQVELDLLYEQLQANEQELSEELAHYRSLYEQAPAAYLILANDGAIIEGNEAAGVLFDESVMSLAGRTLTTLLASGQQAAVNTLLRNCTERGAADGSVELADQRWLTVRTRPTASGDSVLMILTEVSIHSASF